MRRYIKKGKKMPFYDILSKFNNLGSDDGSVGTCHLNIKGGD